jgi:hypothetical protein
MKTGLVVAFASILVVASLQIVATAGVDDPLPCRASADEALADKVRAHVDGGRNRICQMGSDTAVATVTKQTQDDSIAAIRHVISLQLRQGEWRVIMDLHIQRCQPDRGHRTFSRKSCV